MAGTRADEPTERLVDLVGPLWSHDHTATRLGLSPDELTDRCEAGGVLGVPASDGPVGYPVFQFAALPDGPTVVRPHLLRVLQTLRGFDPWAVAVLLLTPADELDDATPVAWARAGGDPSVLDRLAVQVAREWAAGA